PTMTDVPTPERPEMAQDEYCEGFMAGVKYAREAALRGLSQADNLVEKMAFMQERLKETPR
ncbi:unnamed protein product, partial [marine sediment metagenome]